MARLVFFLLALTGATIASLSAHHSFAAYYFEEQSITVEGVVQEFQFRSPHAILVFGARDASGQPRVYAAEWANSTRLSRQGISRDTLQAGDAVIVTGSPGRTPSEYKLHLKRIQRPKDGWSWSNARR